MKNKEKIKQEIKKLADNKYKEFHTGLCPGTNNIIGVRVPVLRNYAKKLLSENSEDILLKSIDNEYYEEVMLQGMIIGLSKNNNFEKDKKYIKEFVSKIDNWAICDVFCAGLKITNKNKEEMLELIKQYLKKETEFELRFAIVMLLDFYITDEYIGYVLEQMGKIKSKDYYVQMAIAWTISICLIKYYDKTISFIKKANLDKFTYNKSLQKAIESYRISKEKKDTLRKLKIK